MDNESVKRYNKIDKGVENPLEICDDTSRTETTLNYEDMYNNLMEENFRLVRENLDLRKIVKLMSRVLDGE